MQFGSSERYFNTLVQICRPNGAVAGAGILIDSVTVVTCAHVASLALGLGKEAAESTIPQQAAVRVRRSFVDGLEAPARPALVQKYIARQRGKRVADIAILNLTERFEDLDRHPLASFGLTDNVLGEQIHAFGFPLDTRETIDQTIPAVYTLSEYMPNNWLFATAAQVQGQEIREGFSGGPVMHRQTGLLLGMVCEADPSRKTATIIPAEVLGEVVAIGLKRVSTKEASDSPETPEVRELSNLPFRRLIDSVFPRLHHKLTVRYRVLADPPERAGLENYVSELKATLAHEISNKTYLPGPAREVGDTPAQPGMGKGKFFSPIQQLIREIAGVSKGGDSASAQISALSKRSRRIRSLISRLLTSPEPLIVLGEPGSGKSITLKQAAIVLSEANRWRVFPTICVFIPLGGWRPPTRPSIADVEAYVRSSVPDRIKPLLSHMADHGRLVVIFDGMDEMSREHYTEKTIALSEYAEKYEGKIHCLFSCRIADYSPAFQHRRLVLLPFDRSHIRQFLIRQFGKVKLEISGRAYSIPSVIKQLESNELPIEPSNPFSLWLITLYLREKKEWPSTRVELLRFLYEYQFERKRLEATESGEAFPDEKAMMAAWGKLASTITKGNRGSEIGVHEVRQLFGQDADQIIHVGRICGVLNQTTDHEPPLIRFEHQRAQEYFTAFDIKNNNEQIDWERLWDVPRWQETLVNLSQMSGERTPVRALSASLMSISAETGLAVLNGLERAEQEALAAERVEFAMRVLRSIAPSPDREVLENELSKAADWLGTNGNPISIVKVLRVAQEMPQLKLWDTVKRTMEHPVRWVREQAQIVAVTLAGNRAASPIPESIASAFGDGSILFSQPYYWRIAQRLRSPGLTGVSVIAGLFFLLQTIALASIVPLATAILVRHIGWGRMVPSSSSIAVVNHFCITLLPWIVSGVSGVAVVAGLFYRAKSCWLISILAGLSALGLTFLVYFGWLWASHVTLRTVFYLLMGAISFFMYVVPVGGLVVLAVGVIAMAFFTLPCAGVLALWSSDRSLFWMTYRVTWAHGVYEDLREFSLEAAKQVWFQYAMIPIIFLIILISKSRFTTRLYPYSVRLPLAPPLLDIWLTVCILATGVGLLYWSVAGFGRTASRKAQKHHRFAMWASIAFVASYAYWLFVLLYRIVADFLVVKLDALLGRFSAAWLLEAIIVLVLLALCGLVLYCSYKVLEFAWRWATRRFILDVRSWTPDMFRRNMRLSSSDDQEVFLSVVTPTTLGVDARTFFSLLIELEPDIKEGPARDKYWTRRAELQDLLRQERSP